jgi:hypothetical protein
LIDEMRSHVLALPDLAKFAIVAAAIVGVLGLAARIIHAGDFAVALGIEWMLAGLDARISASFAIRLPNTATLAQKLKLLAHHNKSRAGCLLNLPAASRPAGSWPV